MANTLSELLKKYWKLEEHDQKVTRENTVMQDVIQEVIDDCPCNKDKPGSPTLCERCLKLRSAKYGGYWDYGER